MFTSMVREEVISGFLSTGHHATYTRMVQQATPSMEPS